MFTQTYINNLWPTFMKKGAMISIYISFQYIQGIFIPFSRYFHIFLKFKMDWRWIVCNQWRKKITLYFWNPHNEHAMYQGEDAKTHKYIKLTSVSFMYLCVSEIADMLGFFPFFPNNSLNRHLPFRVEVLNHMGWYLGH